jgi:hypothetical protein
MKKSKVYLGNKLMKPKEVLKVMEGIPEAKVVYKKAKSNFDAGQVIGMKDLIRPDNTFYLYIE